MKQHAVAEGLEVAVSTTLHPHGLDAGVEAFGGGVRDPQDATWREEYNSFRPHSSLGNLTPDEYAATFDKPTPLVGA